MRQIIANAEKPDVQRVAIRSGDHNLIGRIHRPRGTPTAIAVLNRALGVAAQFFGAFTTWLAQTKGIACLTYDYRDFGASAARPMNEHCRHVIQRQLYPRHISIAI